MRAARVWPRISAAAQLKTFRAASLQPVIFPLRSVDKTAIPPTVPASTGGPCGCELRFTGGIPRVWSDLATVNNGWIEYAASDDHESNLAARKASGQGRGHRS